MSLLNIQLRHYKAKDLLAEIQIRTLEMNFWATIEHTLRYKYDGAYPDEIQHRLERAAEAAYLLDEKCRN